MAALLFMVVPLVNALDSLDPSLVEAGYDLGGSRATVLRQIVIPHAMPGIVAGCVVVFMLTVGNFATPVLLGGKNGLWFTEQIYAQFITRFNWPQGAAFGFLLLALSSAIVWAGLKLSGQSLGRTLRQGLMPMRRPDHRLAPLRRRLLPLPVRAARRRSRSSRSTPAPSRRRRGRASRSNGSSAPALRSAGPACCAIAAMLASIANSLKVALPVTAAGGRPSAPRTPSCSSGRGSAARTSSP